MSVSLGPSQTDSGLESSRSRLRNLTTLRLSGLEVSEATLRLLQRHLPQLECLDLAHCKGMADSSVGLLCAAGTHTRHNLTELTLAGECLALYFFHYDPQTLLKWRYCGSQLLNQQIERGEVINCNI